MVVTFCEHKQLSNMRRKLCELPLTLLLCLALLTGCGTNDFAQSAAPPLATQQTAQLSNNSIEGMLPFENQVADYVQQTGVQIDYATGQSALIGEPVSGPSQQIPAEEPDDVLNHNTHKFHRPSCSSVKDIKPSNRENYTGSRETLIEQGYVACKRCRP